MSQPRTAAGRAFLDALVEAWEGEYGERPDASQHVREGYAADILAIEAEAVAAPMALDPADALVELVGVLDRHPESYRLDSGELGGAYVAALIRARAVARLRV